MACFRNNCDSDTAPTTKALKQEYSKQLLRQQFPFFLKHLGKDIAARFRHIVSGKITEYTEMVSEARKIALRGMIAKAEEMGADAVVNLRFMTSTVVSTHVAAKNYK